MPAIRVRRRGGRRTARRSNRENGGPSGLRAGLPRIFDLTSGTAVSGIREDEAREIATAYAAAARRAWLGEGRPSAEGRLTTPRLLGIAGTDTWTVAGIAASERPWRGMRSRTTRAPRSTSRWRAAASCRSRPPTSGSGTGSARSPTGSTGSPFDATRGSGAPRSSPRSRDASWSSPGSSSESVASGAAKAGGPTRDGISGITSRVSSSASSP